MNNNVTAIEVIRSLQIMGFLQSIGTQSRIVRLLIKTPVVKIRSGNPWHVVKSGKVQGECNLFKVSEKLGGINWDYVKACEKRIAQQLDVPAASVEYTAGESAYIHADDRTPAILVKKSNPTDGVFYLQYFPFKGQVKSYYVNGAGEVVADETVKAWLYAESPRSDFKPAVIAPKLANIVELQTSGVILTTEDAQAAKAAFAIAD